MGVRFLPLDADTEIGPVMLRFEWNALRVGDVVQVHDDSDLRTTPMEGTVTIVQTSPGRFSSNDVAIRLLGRPDVVVRPRRQAVHSASTSRDSCWRCEMFVSRHDAEEMARRSLPDDRAWDFTEPAQRADEPERVTSMMRASRSRSERRP